MTELEKIAYAKSFIDKLANGYNPLDGLPLAEYDVVNNVRLSRCLFYVSDILRQVIENGGIAQPKKKSKSAFYITQDQLSGYEYLEWPIPISVITKKINALIDTEQMKQLNYKQLTGWLISIGALIEQATPDGKKQKRPTDVGKQLGISVETRNGMHGEYQVVLYNKNAQSFILDNIEAIISSERQ